jgi:hypothetical protein
MKKFLTVVAAISLSMGVAKAQAVRLNLAVPNQVVAGDAFTVTLTISKQNLTGFARFHQDLPKGFEAEALDTDNDGAVFSFADQRFRLIWANLPNTPNIEVAYRIRVTDPRLKGYLTLAGRFTYVIGDERQAADVESVPITVSPSGSVDPSQIIDIEAYQNGDVEPVAVAAVNNEVGVEESSSVKVASSSVFVVRQKPYLVDKDYYVNLMVTKGELNGFGKIEEEQLTSNSKVEAIETKGALFSTEGNKISFVWINLPNDNEFVVSYKVTPWQTSSPLNVKGVFTFNNGGNMENVNIAERDVDFSSRVPVPPLAAAQAEQVAPQPREQPRQAQQRGLVFKVQLLATKQSVGNSDAINAYFAKYNISEPIVEEMQGFDPTQFVYKYVVGPFKKYEQAAAVRDMMWAKGISDAFVTCYYNGDRITIQEALMISNRK